LSYEAADRPIGAGIGTDSVGRGCIERATGGAMAGAIVGSIGGAEL
jgi:hypothetical protein